MTSTSLDLPRPHRRGLSRHSDDVASTVVTAPSDRVLKRLAFLGNEKARGTHYEEPP